METPGLRARKKERTRATIVKVALELFARDGFAATTLSDIAAAAEVSPRTVSTYFPTKEGIVFASYAESIGRLRVRLTTREPGATVVDVIGEWASAEAAHQEDVNRITVRGRHNGEPDYARLRQIAIARDPELWALERAYVRPLTDIVAAAFAEELGVPPQALVARIAAETTAVSLMEANARAAQGDMALRDLLVVVLDFVRGGVAAAGTS